MSLHDEGSSPEHIPVPDDPNPPEIEVDQATAPRPEEMIADVGRAEPDVEDHTEHHS